MPNETAIPDTPDFHCLFWDTDIHSVNMEKNKKQVIQRVLNYGNEKTYRWLFQTCQSAQIIDAVKSDKNINRRSAVMIANYFGIAKEDIACLKHASTPNYFPY